MNKLNYMKFCTNPACGALIDVRQISVSAKCWKCGQKIVMGSNGIINGECGYKLPPDIKPEPANEKLAECA